MIRILLALAILLASLLPIDVLAETLEIPLALSSWSNPYEVESADFAVEISVATITEIALRLEGTYWDQQYMCGMPYYSNSASACIELRIGDEVSIEADNAILHSFPSSDDWQPFLFEEVLLSGDPTDWAFLTDGAGQIGLVVNARDVDYVQGYPCSAIVVPITVSSATLLITYDGSLPVEGIPWGAVKVLYR